MFNKGLVQICKMCQISNIEPAIQVKINLLRQKFIMLLVILQRDLQDNESISILVVFQLRRKLPFPQELLQSLSLLYELQLFIQDIVVFLGNADAERPFSCTFCYKSFKRRHHLQDHEAIHRGTLILHFLLPLSPSYPPLFHAQISSHGGLIYV